MTSLGIVAVLRFLYRRLDHRFAEVDCRFADVSLCTVERAVLPFRCLLTAEAKATVRFETDGYSGRRGRGRRCPARVGFAAAGRQRRLLAQWSRSWATGRTPYRQNEQLPGEGRDRDFSSLGKSRAVAMTLFAIKRHGNDTMLVVEAASADAANGWLVFCCADGRPFASLRVEEVLRIETVMARAHDHIPNR